MKNISKKHGFISKNSSLYDNYGKNSDNYDEKCSNITDLRANVVLLDSVKRAKNKTFVQLLQILYVS